MAAAETPLTEALTSQVTHSNLTLEQAIALAQQLFPRPLRMEFNKWQIWRSTMGLRPKKAANGFSTTTHQVADLWHKKMAQTFGEDWRTLLACSKAEDDDDPDSLPGVPKPESGPAAGAVSSPLTSSTPVRETWKAEPGSGPPLYETGSPGSGIGTPSWHSSQRGPPGSLTIRVPEDFDPNRESLAAFEVWMAKQAQALAALEQPLNEGVLLDIVVC